MFRFLFISHGVVSDYLLGQNTDKNDIAIFNNYLIAPRCTV